MHSNLLLGGTDDHLNRFRIHGKDFGVYQIGGPVFNENPSKIRLTAFQFRVGEHFLYEYDFHDCWEHHIRLERILPIDPKRIYPVCIGGKRSAPPEDCGGVLTTVRHVRWESLSDPEETLSRVSLTISETDTVWPQ